MGENWLKTYYIAYFDILGYKNFFDDKENDVLEFLNNMIHVCDETLFKADINSLQYNSKFIVKTFSDNFIIMLEAYENTDDYAILQIYARILAQLQIQFLEEYRILVRGSITKGEAYIDENIVFGNGLIRAVTLESTAIFPRIVVDHGCFAKETCDNLCSNDNWLAKDEDEEYYVDYFRLPTLMADKNRFDTIRRNVIQLIKKYGKYNRSIKDRNKLLEAEKTISKYAWLLCKFNEKCVADKTAEIPFKIVLYYRTMKAEIQIL